MANIFVMKHAMNNRRTAFETTKVHYLHENGNTFGPMWRTWKLISFLYIWANKAFYCRTEVMYLLFVPV